MSRRLMQSVLLAIPLLFVAVSAARAAAADDASPIPKESTDRVLGRIPDYAGGRPSPNILYSTQAIGEAANGPAGSAPRSSSSHAAHGSPHASGHMGAANLQGGSIVKQPITNQAVVKQPITKQPVVKQPIVSPWGQ